MRVKTLTSQNFYNVMRQGKGTAFNATTSSWVRGHKRDQEDDDQENNN
jgi:hypothetical protein